MKEEILTYLNTELPFQLQELFEHYEQQIDALEEENASLKEINIRLTKQVTDQKAALKTLEKNVNLQSPVTRKESTKKSIHSPSPAFSLHNLHVIKEEELDRFIQKFDLQESQIKYFLFDSKGVNETSQIVYFSAFVAPDQMNAFISEKAYKTEQALHKPLRLLASKQYYNFT
ncbi:MAG: hypothetical protein ABS951_14500 [Solibacillus sp.]